MSTYPFQLLASKQVETPAGPNVPTYLTVTTEDTPLRMSFNKINPIRKLRYLQ